MLHFYAALSEKEQVRSEISRWSCATNAVKADAFARTVMPTSIRRMLDDGLSKLANELNAIGMTTARLPWRLPNVFASMGESVTSWPTSRVGGGAA
jgi:hypothetical protein